MAAAVRGASGHLVVRRPEGFTLDLHLELAPGRTTALLGPNGAGKSTALAALAGLLRLDGGHLDLHGRRVDDADADVFVPASDRRVGVVFQEGLLFNHLTVLDNVAFGARCRGRGRAPARAHARHWLDRLDIADLAARWPGQLSGGQAQRVALCRALATDPRLLLLDEPLSALDVAVRASLRRTLAGHLADLEAPRLLVTHDPVEAFLLADHVAILEGGRLTQAGTPEEIRLRPRTPYAADLAGANLLRGDARDGTVMIEGFPLRVADRTLRGATLAVVHPRSVALSADRPASSHRNTWQAEVERVEPLGDRVRIRFGAPLPLTVEVTPEATAELALAPGATVWLAVKATEVATTADR